MDSDDTVSLRAPSMDRELDTSTEEVPMDSSTLGLSSSSQQAPSVPSVTSMSSSATFGLDINQPASNMLLSQPTTPIICGNVTYLPIWIPFKSDSLPASSPSFSLASTFGLDINQSASNMLLSQPTTPIICGNVTYLPI